jgi:hypothetical protein
MNKNRLKIHVFLFIMTHEVEDDKIPLLTISANSLLQTVSTARNTRISSIYTSRELLLVGCCIT